MHGTVLQGKRNDLARSVARQLSVVEVNTDTTLCSTAELMRLMTEAGMNARFATQEGQDALLRITASWNAMVSSRGEMIDTHKALLDLARRFGLNERMWGGDVEKAMDRTPGLSVVERAA